MSLGSVARTVSAMMVAGAILLGLRPVEAGEFTDSAGRRLILPDTINRVMPAGPNADVLIYALASDKLASWSSEHARVHASTKRRLPVVGRFDGPAPTAGPQAILRVRPDIVVEAGVPSPDRVAFADQMQRETGIPYVLLDDSFARMPGMLRSIGAVLGVSQRADDLATYAEHAVAGLRGRLLIRPADQRPRIYYADDASGMETVLPGSRAGEAIDEAGAINVAGALGLGTRTVATREHIREWNPQIIIAANRAFYDSVMRGPAWRGIAAVQAKKVYLMPTDPFGWIDLPTGINRLIGLYWLSGLFYPDPTQDDMHVVMSEFYEKFYGLKLTPAQMQAMLGPAGVPPAENPVGPTSSLLGPGPLGQKLPGTQPGTAPAGMPTPPANVNPFPPTGMPSVGMPGLGMPDAAGGVPGAGAPGLATPGRRPRQAPGGAGAAAPAGGAAAH